MDWTPEGIATAAKPMIDAADAVLYKHTLIEAVGGMCYAYEAILSRLRCQGSWILSLAIQMLMGNIVGGVDWKCVGVVYYVCRAAFVVIDVVVLYIRAAWIE